MTGEPLPTSERDRGERERVLRLKRPWRAAGWQPPIVYNEFPDPSLADEDGVVAVSGSFSPRTLLKAYLKGIFPWPSDELAHIWYSPDPRLLLLPHEVHVSRSLERNMRRGELELSFDRAFDQVIEACSAAQSRKTEGTWIVEELKDGFRQLHQKGLAHSVEVWRGENLVGGLYGLSLGAMFCGESMFHLEADSSKIAFVALAQKLAEWNYLFLDCQVHTEHLARLGAREWRREDYLKLLEEALKLPTKLGSWAEESLALASRPA